ncbi:MAG: SGNH/GDSL hydrolase family protein [Planctomycetales bacterium]|nr:SGNH/GDSL hydrolase family protein [Planctomycetales bacterium]
MIRSLCVIGCLALSFNVADTSRSQTTAMPRTPVDASPYEYEVKPDHPAFAKFNLRKAPQPGPLIFEKGDRLAICGDSITEQRRYSQIIETYLTACTPQLEITVRQYGWSGEKTDGFLRRMEQDCLRFKPDVATLFYGMNDSRYRPFDVTNGLWYADHYRQIVRNFKDSDVRVVLGGPGSAGKLASWVKSRVGSLDDHNLHLAALRDIAIELARREDVALADVFWPMYQAQVFGPEQHHATEENPYEVAGADGIHPGWAGHAVIAYAFLRAMGLDGRIGEFTLDWDSGDCECSDGHTVQSYDDGLLTIVSERYPYCARGDLDDDDSIASGISLVPFQEDLNQFRLTVANLPSGAYQVTWGETTRNYDANELAAGVNLAADFAENPFSAAFARVEVAVAAKQKFETHQIKQVFHGEEGKADFEKAVASTEAQRLPLAEAIAAARQSVEHQIRIRRADN